ncbi:MAG: hypothetical protein ABR591_01030 [Candidatus Velthaea sp.]
MTNVWAALLLAAWAFRADPAGPPGTAGPPPDTPGWLGVTLGEPAAGLRGRLGDPLLVRPYGISRVASYLRADDPAAALNVTERDGVVFAVEYVRERPEPNAALTARDPYGIAVGMPVKDLAAKRGKPAIETTNSLYYPVDSQSRATVIYRFEDGRIDSIKLVGSPANAAGNDKLPQIAEARGDGYGTAILDLSESVPESQHFRERYLAVHDCAGTGRTATAERREARVYAVITATCADRKRTLYFDVTRATAQ